MDDSLAVRIAHRLTARQKVGLDVLLGAALAGASVPVTQRDMHAAGAHGGWLGTLGYIAVALAAACLSARRRYPRTALAVSVLAEAVLIGLGERLPVFLAPGFTMYSLAAASAALSGWVVAAALAPMSVGAVLAWDSQAVENSIFAALLACGSVLVGWLAGENARSRRSHALALAEQAAEHERDRARRTATLERARIARELHDVVAHAMSVIAVRSGVARRLGASQPEQAAEALQIIEEVSRRSLGELRRLVTVLREAEEPGAADIEPARGLADLPELVSHVAAAGVDVEVRVAGNRRPLPPTEDLTAYRIAQEALTNVVRHGAAGHATLSLLYGDGLVEIECVNPAGDHPRAVAARDGHGGHGIVSMRERVALFGGEFSAGPAGTMFRVLARLPVAEEPL